ncbi:MAG: hypothetical protein ACT4O0_10810 [Pseudonocardia sp.]
MYDWVEAFRLETESRISRYSETNVGATVGGRGENLSASYRKVLTRAGSGELGARAGGGARKLAGFLAELPVLSLPADAINRSHCVDLLEADVRADPGNPLRLIQLAEARDAAQRDLVLTRTARAIIDPTSVLTSGGLRAATTLGTADGPTPVERRIRRSHRHVVRAGGPSSFAHSLALGRCYRLAGKPGLATHFATEAMRVGLAERDRARPAVGIRSRMSRAMRRGGIGDVIGELAQLADDKVEANYLGDIGKLSDVDRVEKQLGATWTVLAWAYRDLGNLEVARAAARRATALGFTCGYEVLAATLAHEGGFVDGISKRQDLLAKVARMDRAYYRGHWRGSLRISGSTAQSQVTKAVRLINRV